MQPTDQAETASLKEDGDVLHLSGRLDSDGAARIWQDAHRAVKANPKLRIDAGKVDYCDGAGIALLFDLSLRTKSKVENLRAESQELLDQFSAQDFAKKRQRVKHTSFVEITGQWGAQTWGDLREQVTFLGRMAVIGLSAFRHPQQIRWADMWVVLEKAGVNAVGIVGLIGFLMGMIMAFQSAMPLRQFGAEIFIVNLVALAMLRELGPIMTAIVLAGRSGSAFAAEIGTMKVNEELNALKTMGLDDARFLVAPRVIAGIIAAPLLTIYANLAGIIGGFFVMISMGFPFAALYHQMISAVEIKDLASGLVKAVLFGILVAGIGCLRGLQTKSGATAVGDSTTRAVVSSIILVVLCDCIFAMVFYIIDF